MAQTQTLPAHSHGAGAPQDSRAERLTSFDLADFPEPTGREEEWRFTPVDLVSDLFEVAEGSSDALDVLVEAPGAVEHGPLDADDPLRGSVFRPADRAAAAAWASTKGGLAVRIPAQTELTEPVFVHVRGTGGRASGHLVIDAGAGSTAVVVVEHSGPTRAGLNVEIRVGDGAQLNVVSLQDWADDAVHVGQQDALVGRDARLTHFAVSLGGRVVRLCTNVRYSGPGAHAELLGLYFADAGQHLENRLFVDHEPPHCTSRVTYRGALQGDTAHTVWVGDVLIRAKAEGTDTYEVNRNLVLTDGARADSVPNLEIETGEIIGAGHASATGRFDDEQLFYLQSRGIPEREARRLVVRGFFADLVQRIGIPALQERLLAAIEAELARSVL